MSIIQDEFVNENDFSIEESENDNKEYEDKSIDVEDLLGSKISYTSQTMDIETVLLGVGRGDYKLPLYQRKYVWQMKDACNLILSLIKNIPIPPVYLYHDGKTGEYIILDGQQRISSIFMYYNNIFYTDNKKRIRLDFKEISYLLKRKEELLEKINQYKDIYTKEELEKFNKSIIDIEQEIAEKYKLKNKKFMINNEDISFEKFDEKIKRSLKRKRIEVVFVQCIGSNPQKAYTQIFKLLNSSGKALSTQEIRNGIYFDNCLYKEVNQINEENIVWRNLYGNSLISKDFEYLLRFLALDYYSEYDFKTGKITIEREKNNKNNKPKAFSLAGIIDDYSDRFNNKELKYEAKKEVEKLQVFFEKFKDINSTNDLVPGGKILIIEALFIGMSKLGLLEKSLNINYYGFIDKLDLSKDFGVVKATSNKAITIKRIEKGIDILKREFSEWLY